MDWVINILYSYKNQNHQRALKKYMFYHPEDPKTTKRRCHLASSDVSDQKASIALPERRWISI